MRWRRGRLLRERPAGGSVWPRRVFYLLAAASFLVLAAWSAIDVVDVAGDLRAAEKRIDEADRALKEARVGDAEAALDQAESLLAEANDELRSSPGLVLLRRAPVIGANLASLDRTVEVAATLVHGGRQILATSETLQDADGDLAVELVEGSVPAGAVDRALTEIRALLVALNTHAQPSTGLTVLPPMRDLEDRVYGQVDEQAEHLVRLRRGLVILDQLVGVTKPRRTILAVANTAEMRGSGGMMLNYGVLEAAEGAVTISEFGRVEELVVTAPPDPDSLGIPQDYQRLWGDFDYTHDWRNATLSGDFTNDAPTLLAMFRNATQMQADNVIQIDADGLAALLSVTGPVEVEDLGTVSSENVVDLVLNEAYVLFPDRDTRTDILGDVAEEAFRALVEGDYPSVADLAEALDEAVAGRHLMMYSAEPKAQAGLDHFGATGDLPDADQLDHLYLSVQNMGGNKLDYYVDTDIDVVGNRTPGQVGELSVTVTVANGAPTDQTEPGYIFGPATDDQTAGTYRGAVTLYMPQGTSVVESSGDAFYSEPTAASEGGRPVVTYWVEIPAGASHEARLALRLAPTPGDAEYTMTLVPSPRVRDTTASVDVNVGDDRRVAGEVVLDRTWRIGPQGAVEVRSE